MRLPFKTNGVLLSTLAFVMLGGAAQVARAADEPRKREGAPAAHVHEQAFSVITAGSGNPIPNIERAGPSTVIQYRGKYYMLDTGNGSAVNMAAKGYALRNIRAIVYTHLHADHVTDFVDVMINRWMSGGKELEIIGPPRSGDYYRFMLSFFADDLRYRQMRGRPQGVSDLGMFSGVKVKTLTGSKSFALDGMAVRTAVMTHTQYDLAYRFDAEGKSIVVSGDTSYTANLVSLARDADILLIDANITTATAEAGRDEALFADGNTQRPKPAYRFSGNFEVPPHMGMDAIAKTAVEANVRKVILTHLPPGPFDLAKAKGFFAEAGFKGEVLEAKDGLEFQP